MLDELFMTRRSGSHHQQGRSCPVSLATQAW